MTAPAYNMVNTSEGRSTIVLMLPTGPRTITDSHPNYLRIATALLNDEDPTAMLDGSSLRTVANLSSRVSIVDEVLHFDGDAVYNGLAETISRYHLEGRDATNLVRFMERLSANPSANSREQLFNWTMARDLVIDADGYIIGYKGVYSRDDDSDYLDDLDQPIFPLERYPFQSSGSGHGIVDGHEINGHLPMGVGVTVEMPRREVNDNPNAGCSTGLHVGTYSYAQGYSHSGALLEVRFDPADVVSVPADCGFQKLRCCRYTGIAIHEADTDDLSDYEPEATDDFDDDAAWDEFATSVPAGWVSRLRQRLTGKDE